MPINYSDLLCSTYLPYTETEEATLFDSTHDFPCAANLRVLNFLTKNAISTKFSKFLKRFPKRSKRPFMLSQFSWFNPNVVETNPTSWLSLTPLNFKNLEKKCNVHIISCNIIGTYVDFDASPPLPAISLYYGESCEHKVHTIYLLFELKRKILANIKFFSVKVEYMHHGNQFYVDNFCNNANSPPNQSQTCDENRKFLMSQLLCT